MTIFLRAVLLVAVISGAIQSTHAMSSGMPVYDDFNNCGELLKSTTIYFNDLENQMLVVVPGSPESKEVCREIKDAVNTFNTTVGLYARSDAKLREEYSLDLQGFYNEAVAQIKKMAQKTTNLLTFTILKNMRACIVKKTMNMRELLTDSCFILMHGDAKLLLSGLSGLVADEHELAYELVVVIAEKNLVNSAENFLLYPLLHCILLDEARVAQYAGRIGAFFIQDNSQDDSVLDDSIKKLHADARTLVQKEYMKILLHENSLLVCAAMEHADVCAELAQEAACYAEEIRKKLPVGSHRITFDRTPRVVPAVVQLEKPCDDDAEDLQRYTLLVQELEAGIDRGAENNKVSKKKVARLARTLHQAVNQLERADCKNRELYAHAMRNLEQAWLLTPTMLEIAEQCLETATLHELFIYQQVLSVELAMGASQTALEEHAEVYEGLCLTFLERMKILVERGAIQDCDDYVLVDELVSAACDDSRLSVRRAGGSLNFAVWCSKNL